MCNDCSFFFQAEDGIRDLVRSRGLGDVYKRQVITSAVTDARLADLASRDVDLVLDSTPQPFESTVDVATLEAMMRAAVRAPGGAPERLSDDDLLEMIVAAGLEPRVLQPNGPVSYTHLTLPTSDLV